MKRIAWATDIHLNFPAEDGRSAFYKRILDTGAEALLISGDIGEAPSVGGYLLEMQNYLKTPIYFVLGNHDFYRGSIAGIRAQVAALAGGEKLLTYLSVAGVIEITSTACLLGHDGWADGRLGDYAGSRVMLSDYIWIDEVAGLNKAARHQQLQNLGDEAAEYFRKILPLAFETYRRVILVTHVPPFREACWHRGHICDDDYLPHFGCKVIGDVIQEAMVARPERELTVLCGHTHGSGQARILDNLTVLTGGAEYGKPRIQQVLDIE